MAHFYYMAHLVLAIKLLSTSVLCRLQVGKRILCSPFVGSIQLLWQSAVQLVKQNESTVYTLALFQ